MPLAAASLWATGVVFSFSFLLFSSKSFGHMQAAQKLEQEAFVPEEEADDEVSLATIKFNFCMSYLVCSCVLP